MEPSTSPGSAPMPNLAAAPDFSSAAQRGQARALHDLPKEIPGFCAICASRPAEHADA